MNKADLYNEIDSLASDIEFDYKGIHGSVCPFNRSDVVISYGDTERRHTSIDNAMNDKIYDGKCLNEIANELEIY